MTTKIRDRIIKEIERVDLIQNYEKESNGTTDKWLSLSSKKLGLYKALEILDTATYEALKMLNKTKKEV